MSAPILAWHFLQEDRRLRYPPHTKVPPACWQTLDHAPGPNRDLPNVCPGCDRWRVLSEAGLCELCLALAEGTHR